MADRYSMHDDGYAQEQAIASNLERYLRDSLAAVDPPIEVGCWVKAENHGKRVRFVFPATRYARAGSRMENSAVRKRAWQKRDGGRLLRS